MTSDAVRDDALTVRSRHEDTRGAASEILAVLGHQGGNVAQTVSGARWFAYCACGFVSSTSGTEADAMGKLVHHLRLEMRRWKVAGVPLLAMPPAPPADWAEVRRRHPHFRAFWDANEKEAARLTEIVGARS